METFTDTAEILAHLTRLHRRLQHDYDQGRETVRRERVKMLLDSASAHQEEAADAIARFEQQASARRLEAHFQYTPKGLDRFPFEFEAVRPEMTVDEAARLIAGHFSELADIYGRLAEMSSLAEVAEVFQSLAQQLGAMRDRLAQSSQQLKDI